VTSAVDVQGTVDEKIYLVEARCKVDLRMVHYCSFPTSTVGTSFYFWLVQKPTLPHISGGAQGGLGLLLESVVHVSSRNCRPPKTLPKDHGCSCAPSK
jgi:hypothetical protein